MDLYRKVRLACAEGMSEREAARQFGISRESVRSWEDQQTIRGIVWHRRTSSGRS
ncbi:helix-turn-helix domain-containing protein [Phaeovulum sp.]|uniref:helix-turn-helix domain-containing protein n=1 Tax=Phaeovulum sp. TaxID=2934796 RepID=UPI0039E5AAE4